LYKEFYDEKGVAKKEKIGVDILLQILEYNLQDISSSVKYSHDDKAIKIGYYSIILKFTSTRGICQKFYQILKNTYFYPDNFRSNTSFTILLLIIVDGGKSQYEIEESYYKFVEKSGVEMINRVIENKLVKIFYIDARLNRT
jgi:hypothetical protein